MAHNRCVLKERRIHPLVLSPVLRWRTVWGWRWGLLAVGLCGIGPALAGNVGAGWAFARPRDGGSGCRRSNARCGPIPLPPGAPSGILYVSKSRSLSTVWDGVPSRVLVCARGLGVRFQCSLRPDPAAARGALLNPLRCQKQILFNGSGLGSLLGSCLHEGSWGSATWTRYSDPHPDNEPWTTTGPRISCNLER
jgi:hypothetical protein